MSFYSSAITTRLIDPVFNQVNQRCEFRLPTNTLLLSNMRLLNVGVLAVPELGTAKYNFLVGAYGCIRNIRLLDGNQQLDAINDVNRWLAFKNYTKNNTVSSNMNNTLSRNGSGYVFDQPTAFLLAEDLDQQYVDGSDFSVIQPFKDSGNIRHTEDGAEGTTSAWLSLRDLFPMLGSVVNINTAVFKDLRLVIEFSKDTTDFAVDLNVLEGLVHRFATLQPLLAVDEMADSPMKEAIMKKFEPISFNAIEQDRVNVKLIPGREIVSNTFQIQGFNNKRVGRICVQKVRAKNSVNNSLELSNMGSPVMLDEQYQWRLNGSNVYPYAIQHYNEALALTNDIWGTSTQPLGGIPFMGTNETTETSLPAHFPKARELLGETSYLSANLYFERVRELQFTYQRFGEGTDADTIYRDPLTLLIYAEVQKVIVPSKNGGYIVSNL